MSCPNLHIENSIIPFYQRNDNNFPDIINLSEINILCCSGLSNRIRTILGFLEVCNFYKKKLNVIWIKDNTCNGVFLDYFKPINNVKFIEQPDRIDYKGQSTIEKITSYYKVKYNISELYSNIKLNDILENKINNYVKKCNIENLAGIHVRRTDYTGNFIGKLINGSNSDFDFFDYIEKYSINDNFFLATDNKETQDIYKNKYGNKVLYYKKIKDSDKLRKTSLENAIIDIYILSYCKRIKGTYNSSFTEFAKNLKKSRKIFYYK
jgi:hypothetical protein